MSRWHKRAFCKCGFDAGEPAFGDIWFTRQHYPVCPQCGESGYGFELKTVRRIINGWFKKDTFEEKSVSEVHG